MRNIGIVGDGETDRAIFEKFIQCVLLNGTFNTTSFNICKYGTDDLRRLRDQDFEEKALNYITPDSVDRIFSYVPESRLFIQMLSLGKHGVDRPE